MMSNRIVYQLHGQPVSILIPCDCGLTIQQIGQKDVPHGVPFWIVDADSLPTDRAFRDAWELDAASMGSSHGLGSKA